MALEKGYGHGDVVDKSSREFKAHKTILVIKFDLSHYRKLSATSKRFEIKSCSVNLVDVVVDADVLPLSDVDGDEPADGAQLPFQVSNPGLSRVARNCSETK